ncbi:MAG: SIS domain-containing protein, partial [Alistipes sp.]|nr:SIS domain-containing protein [Alistipes sp.]
MSNYTSQDIFASAKRTLTLEAEALNNLADILDEQFVGAVDRILNCKGKVIITGMGKSGLVGRKIAATLASTGSPSFYLHPGEAFHGDLGMISSEDVVLALSHSGETDEVLKI